MSKRFDNNKYKDHESKIIQAGRMVMSLKLSKRAEWNTYRAMKSRTIIFSKI